MLNIRWIAVLVAWTASSASVPCAWAADWINFYPVSGELTLGFDGRWRELPSGESGWQLRYEERLALSFGGYALDRRFLTFNFRLEPSLWQRESDAPNTAAGSIEEDSQFLSYNAGLSLLHGVPAAPISLSANLSAGRSETEDSLGSRRDSIQESRVAGLILKFKPFPSSITYRERVLEEEFISPYAVAPVERDETQRTLTYQGRSRGMELFLEGTEFEDNIGNNDYQSGLARLTNRFAWGKNSSFTSRLEHRTREGFSQQESFSARETLRLQHTNNLYTAYGYQYTTSRRTTDVERHAGNFELNHRLYTNLVSSLKLSGSNTASSNLFRERNRNGSLDFQYGKRFSSNMRVAANLGGGYGTTFRIGGELDSAETHTVPASGLVVLDTRYIEWPSIIVTAPGCSPCLEGSDYLVEDAGGDLTQLRIPAGSRIAIDDSINVDFVFRPPTVEYYGIPYRVGFRVEYGPFTFYHSTSGVEQTYVTGPDPTAVEDRRTHRTGVDWKWAGDRTNVAASIEAVLSKTADRTSAEYYLRQSLNRAIAPNAKLNVVFSETFSDNSTDSQTYSGDISVVWIPAPRLTVKPRATAFRRSVDPGGTDTRLRTGLTVNWKWRQISLEFLYDHTIQESNDQMRTEDRVYAKFKRKF